MSKEVRIAQLLEAGVLTQDQISRTLHVSRNLVRAIKQAMNAHGYSALDLEKMDEDKLKEVCQRADLPRKKPKEESIYAMPDYEFLAKELAKPKVTQQLLWEEYRDDCLKSGLVPYQLTQFKVHFAEYLEKSSFSEVIEHKPGEEIQVDWPGDKPHWFDPDTGERVEGCMFVAVLSFSGLAYAEVFPDEKEPSWINAHAHMYSYFGGTATILKCDNLKTGVVSHLAKSDPILQHDYKALGEHYGVLIVPGGVRKPKHKPLVENTCGKAETELIARMRNFRAYSVEEYNEELRKNLEHFNNKPFQAKPGSRRSTFEDYEKQTLHPLPQFPYEYCSTKEAKVQSNCCISYKKCYYSAPYKYIGSKVTLKVYSTRLEIWTKEADPKLLCIHKIVVGKLGAYSIDNSHLPPDSSKYGNWNSERLLHWAEDFGPYTYEVIGRLFQIKPEQTQYNGAKSLLKLADQYSRPRVEKACQLALRHYKRPRYRDIRAILENGQDLQLLDTEQNGKDRNKAYKDEKSYTRGPEYYGKKK